jgi:ligand-binding SRPBCC domain-containing protein
MKEIDYVGAIVNASRQLNPNKPFESLGWRHNHQAGWFEEVGDNCFIKQDKYKIPKETVRKTSHPFYTKLFNYIFRRNKTKKT